jgi:hypothetical protein
VSTALDPTASDPTRALDLMGPHTALPPRVERWRRRSATGAMMTGFALGLREVLETEQREPAIVLETAGVPPRALPVEADIDNLPPRQSVVKIRRWLLSGSNQDGATADRIDTDPDDETAVAPGRTTEIRSREANRKRRPRPPRGLFRSEGKRP